VAAALPRDEHRSRVGAVGAAGLAVLLACSELRPSGVALAEEDLAVENERLRLAVENEHLRQELARLRSEKERKGDAAEAPRAPAAPLGLAALASKEKHGTHVYVWGQRAAFPVCEESGDKQPDADVRAPVEAQWFRLHAERHDCLWHQLAFGPNFGAARSSTGELFLWGSYRKDANFGRRFMAPQLLRSDGSQVRFRDVQCSETAVWGLTDEGEVLVWERVSEIIQEATGSKKRPIRPGRVVEGFERPVRSMSIGSSHASFVIEDGELYCLGANRNGECGADPNKQPIVASLQRVQFAAGVTPILEATCGRSHTVALSSNGRSFAWGDDSKIQLGLGDTRSNFGDERPFSGSAGFHRKMETGEGMTPSSISRSGPGGGGGVASMAAKKYTEYSPHCQEQPVMMQEIPLEFERQQHGIPYPPASGLVCGDDFTILIARDSPEWFSPEEETNRLFCCGDNERGQCGRSMQTAHQTFAACRTPRHSRTESASCGSGHCLAVLKRVGAGSQKPELWVWGKNDKGQAAHPTVSWVCPAKRIRVGHGMHIEVAWCGSSSSGVICTERQKGNSSIRSAVSVKTRQEDLEE